MITINELLNTVLKDFQDYVASQDQLCSLLEMHYDAGRLPDYNDVHKQQLYLLRYAYAYAFEYKHMYRMLIHEYVFDRMISVTSIGCGNCIDYWSLAKTVGDKYSIKYRGIENVDWAYKIMPRHGDTVETEKADVVSLLQNLHDAFSSDIYIFPKSVSEFSEGEVLALASCFTRDTVAKDRVHFMFSLRTDSDSLDRDKYKTGLFYNQLSANGFYSRTDRDSHFVFKQDIKDKFIHQVDDDFQHPGNVVDFLKDLYTRCKSYGGCGNEAECTDRLRRWPILRCKYAAWQAFTFER